MQYDDVLGREAENELSSTQPDRPAVLANRNSYSRQEKREEDIRAGLVGSMKIIAGGKDYMDEQETDEVFLNLPTTTRARRAGPLVEQDPPTLWWRERRDSVKSILSSNIQEEQNNERELWSFETCLSTVLVSMADT